MSDDLVSIGEFNVRIEWDDEISQIQHDLILAQLVRLSRFFPRWLQRIRFIREKGLSTRIFTYDEYQTLDIWVDDCSFKSDEKLRRDLRHELCHAYTMPIRREAIETIDRVVKDKDLRKVLSELLKRRDEFCATSLSDVLERLDPEP